MPTINGSAGPDTINSAAGSSDTIYAGAGDDLIRLGELDSGDRIYGEAGFDTLIISSQSAIPPNTSNFRADEIEHVILIGSSDFDLITRYSDRPFTGTSSGSRMIFDALSLEGNAKVKLDAFWMNPNGIIFYGGNGDDTVIGTNASDILAGNGGANELLGGGGDDVFVVSSPNTILRELMGASNGYDTVYASVSYALQTPEGWGYIEALSTQSQQGTESINLVGNFVAQQVIGNFGNNVLNGNGGADTLIGLKGNDIYAIADASAVIVENPGEGHDIVYTSVGYTLTGLAEIEELSFATQAGTENMNIIGNGYNQNVVGNFGNNVLNGNGGIDTLIGLKGDDTYVVGNAASIIQENAGEGYDVAFTSVSYALAPDASIEVLATQTASETGAITLKGNEVAQLVTGNNGDNVIDGGDGHDTLQGLGGADTFAFSTALGAGNVDAIADFGNGADRIQLSASVFTGLSAGPLAASAFVTGTAATDASHRIVYDKATGRLFFDADGSGSGAAVLFAAVTAGTDITAGMITVV